MSIIQHRRKEDDCFDIGSAFIPLFNSEIDVWIENSVSPEYAESCAKHLAELSAELTDRICERAVAYLRFMKEEWKDFESVSGGILDTINSTIPETVHGREILQYITSPGMFILSPSNSSIGYAINCNCIWEPEHGMDIIIRDDRLLYVGPSEGFTAWEDDDLYETDY